MIAVAIPMIVVAMFAILVTIVGMTMTAMPTRTAIEATSAAGQGPFVIKRTALSRVTPIVETPTRALATMRTLGWLSAQAWAPAC